MLVIDICEYWVLEAAFLYSYSTEQNLQLSPEVHPRHGVEKEVNAVVEAEDGFGDVEGSTEVG